MRGIARFRVFLAALLLGGGAPSCATDFRDSLIAGAMDAVSGTVTDSIRAVIPLPEILEALRPPA